MANKSKYLPIVLLILDGWGISPSWGGNAITMNNPKIMSLYWRQFPHVVLQAFKKIVGPSGKVGNSEIGHGSIGTGRTILQDMTRIGQSIIDGTFMKNPTLLAMTGHVKQNKSAFHIYGLLSDGGVHSHVDHALALADFVAKEGLTNVYFHLTLDGRDAGSTSALEFISTLENRLKINKVGRIASIVGRFYAMDRDNHWSRTAVAYKAMAEGIGDRFDSASSAVSAMYRRGFEDELMPPCVIVQNKTFAQVQNNDAVLCFNFRADRSRQMAKLFLGEQKLGVFFHAPQNIFFAGLATYLLKTPMHSIFPPTVVKNSLAEVLSHNNLKQFHIAESEKRAHVTYFFNGGKEAPFRGEDRAIIASPDVVSYSQTPKMSAEPLTNELLRRIGSNKYQFLVANYANADMVGHTGDITAASIAILTIDEQVNRVIKATISRGGMVIITADHGNAEQMIGLRRYQNTSTMHTINPVPFIMVANDLEGHILNSPSSSTNLLSEIMSSEHSLADVAPTILDIMGIEKPAEMTGMSLMSLLE